MSLRRIIFEVSNQGRPSLGKPQEKNDLNSPEGESKKQLENSNNHSVSSLRMNYYTRLVIYESI